MITVLSILGLALLGGAWLMVRELAHAPEGYQDETGFHTADATASAQKEASFVPGKSIRDARAA